MPSRRRATRCLRLSREIHAHPELAFEERRAAALLIAALREGGLRVEPGAYGLETAFAAEFGSPRGPCVALLAEYDALPGIGHACGHNLIAASALGAALALAPLAEQSARARAHARHAGRGARRRQGADGARRAPSTASTPR